MGTLVTAHHVIDTFSPATYLDGQKAAEDCRAFCVQRLVVWIEQLPYHLFWAVLSRDAVLDVKRDD